MLCDRCNAISFSYRTPIGGQSEESIYCLHQPSKEKLYESASRGCHFCAMICHKMFVATDVMRHYASPIEGAEEAVVLRRTWLPEWIEKEGMWPLFLEEQICVHFGKESVYLQVKPRFPCKWFI